MPELVIDPNLHKTSFTPKLEKFASLTLSEKHSIVKKIAKNLSFVGVFLLPSMVDPVYMVQRGFGLPGLRDAKLVLENGKPDGFRDSTWSGIVKTCNAYSRAIQTYHEGKTPELMKDWTTQRVYDIKKRAIPREWMQTTLLPAGKAMAVATSWIMTANYYYCWLKNIILRIPPGVARMTPQQIRDLGVDSGSLSIAQDAFEFFKLPLYRSLVTQMGYYTKTSNNTSLKTSTHSWRYIIDPFKVALDQLPIMLVPSPVNRKDTGSAWNYETRHLSKFFSKDSTSSVAFTKVKPEIASLLSNEDLFLDRIRTAIEVSRLGIVKEEVQSQVVSAGITSAPVLPFYQKPAFTLAAAGGIFVVGYAILKARK